MANGHCFHCAAAIPRNTDITLESADGKISFCCDGCLGAYLIITGSGLEEYYRRREIKQAGAPPKNSPSFSSAALMRHAYELDGKSAIDINIGGIHCASCVWLNENIISRLPGVEDVRVNYATNRARVLFDAEIINPAQIFSRISELGYVPRPYDRKSAVESAEKEKKELLLRFGTAIFLGMQLMAYSFALYAGYFQGISDEIKFYLQLFSLLVTTPVVFYSGAPFLHGAWRSLINKTPDMDILIATGALSSYIYSIYATIKGGEVYYETAAMIVTLILVGRILENSAKRRAASGVEQLLELAENGRAVRIRDGVREEVETAELKEGDCIVISAGERFPVDGMIAEGCTDVDESLATGEPLPAHKETGDCVISGSMNLTGTIKLSCTRPREKSFVARIARLIEEAQNRRAPIQKIADRTAAYFVPLVLFLGVITFIWHMSHGAFFDSALMTALAVIVIACPCALGLATPTAILAASGGAAKNGIIFKGGDILERLAAINLVVLDKTGTITEGKPSVISVHPADRIDSSRLVSITASIESASRHPLAMAVCKYAESKNIRYDMAEQATTVPGGGVAGIIGKEQVAAGSASYLKSLGITGEIPEIASSPGSMAVYVSYMGKYAGAFLFRDKLRHDASILTGYFESLGIKTVLLSGDRQENAESASAAAGISEAIGGYSPSDKVSYIEDMQKKGFKVLMIGDGINDAPALAAADTGCAVAGGTDIAVETSDMLIAGHDLEKITLAHRMAKKTMKIIRQNLCWAFLYNMTGIPLAMFGALTPVYAAAAMSLSSICVVGNSLRLLVSPRSGTKRFNTATLHDQGWENG